MKFGAVGAAVGLPQVLLLLAGFSGVTGLVWGLGVLLWLPASGFAFVLGFIALRSTSIGVDRRLGRVHGYVAIAIASRSRLANWRICMMKCEGSSMTKLMMGCSHRGWSDQ